MCQVSIKLLFRDSIHCVLDPFACSHHRAADYFTESIKSDRGENVESFNFYFIELLIINQSIIYRFLGLAMQFLLQLFAWNVSTFE